MHGQTDIQFFSCTTYRWFSSAAKAAQRRDRGGERRGATAEQSLGDLRPMIINNLCFCIKPQIQKKLNVA